MDILNKKKVGGRGGQTDYVFHFHFALCLNKQFLTALFSKPTFSQLLSGTTERENNTQDVQDYLTLHTRFTQQSVVWLHKSQGELQGKGSSLGETGWLHNNSPLGGFTQTLMPCQGEAALCQALVTVPILLQELICCFPLIHNSTETWETTLNNSLEGRSEKTALKNPSGIATCSI